MIGCFLLTTSQILIGQTTIDVDLPGQSYTNTNTDILDSYTVDVSECSSISFSVDYNFNQLWVGSGNMEMSSECISGCAGDPTDPQGGGCDNCWDFMWMQFFIGGSEVDSELIGEAGTTDAEMSGTYTTPIFCLDGETEASIDITNQNWAANETNSFSNVIIMCWEGAPEVITNDPICGSDDLTLDGDAGDPSVVTDWLWTNDGGGSIDDDTAQNTFATGPEDGEEYTLTTTDENGCDATSMVTVSILDVPEIFPAGPLEICDISNDDEEDFDLTTLDDDISGGTGTVLWYEDPGMTNAIGTPWSYTSGPTTVYAVVEENGCFSLEEMVDLVLLVTPEPEATSNFISFCIGDGEDLELDEIGDFGDSWEWEGPDGFEAFIQDPVVNITSTAQSGTYTVTVTDVSGNCTATSEVVIDVGDTPNAIADANSTVLCGGSTLQLDEIGGEGTSWDWTGPDGFVSSIQNPTITDVDSSNDGDYVVTVSDASGCSSSSTISISVGDITAGISGGADLCPNECTDSSTDLSFILTGGTAPYDVVVSVNSITLPGFAIDINTTIRVCHDDGLILPDVDDSSDPIVVSLPDAFLPLTLQLISVVDDEGCDAMIDPGNNIISLNLLTAPPITDPDPGPYCLDQTETVDLTTMDDEITNGDGALTVEWYADMDLENEISNPSSYDINDGLTVYAVVTDGDCFSESVEVMLTVFPTPEITVTDEIIDCAFPYELPDPEDLADISNSNNPVYFLDPALTDGPYTGGSFIDPTDITSIYIYDNNGPCNDFAEVNFMVTIPPIIESPLLQLGGCGSIILPLPELDGNVIDFEYNTEIDGSGADFDAGDEIFESDNITILYLIVTGEDNCIVTEELEIVLATSINYEADIAAENCDMVVLPEILPATSNVAYYEESNGVGVSYLPGDTLMGVNGSTLIFDLFLFDPDQDPQCAPEVPIQFNIAIGPQILLPGDTLVCGMYELPEFNSQVEGNPVYSLVPNNDTTQFLDIEDTIFQTEQIFVLDTIASCTFLDSFLVSINTIPYTGSDNTINICEGFDVFNFNLMELLSFPDEGGQWNYPVVPDFNPVDSTDVDLSVLIPGSYTLTYAVEDTCGITSSFLDIEVNPLPYSGVDSILALCPGDPAQDLMALLSFPELGGEWSQLAGPTMVDITDSTSVVFNTAEGGYYAFTYTIPGTLQGSFCNASASSLVIDIADGPNAGADIAYTACIGDVIDIVTILSPDADMNGLVEPDGFLISGTTWNTSSATANQTYNLSYIVESAAPNCANDTSLIQIYLTEDITAGMAVSTNEVCTGESIMLSDYIENETPGGIFALANDHSNAVNDEWIADQSTTFSYIVPQTGGCPGDSIDFEIVVNPVPTLDYNAGDLNLCAASSDCVDITFNSGQFVAADFDLIDLGNNNQWPLSQSINMSAVLTICPSGVQGETSLNTDTLYLGNQSTQFELVPIQVMDIFTYCMADINNAAPITFQLFPSYDETLEYTLCEGEAVNINGQDYFSTTDINLLTEEFCDSTIHILIDNYPSEVGLVNEIYCEGDVIDILGQVFDQDTSGTFMFEGSSVFGCDSIIDIDISFQSSVFGDVSSTLCPEESIDVEGEIFDINNASGMVLLANGSTNGCDSTIVVDLNFYQSAEYDLDMVLCEGESIQVGSDTYDANQNSGTSILNGQSVNGCDSIVNVNLSFNQSSSFVIDDILCEDQDYVVNGMVYNAGNPSGMEVIQAGNQNGCDSIVNINLTFELPSADISTVPSCPDENMATILIENTFGLDLPVEVLLDNALIGSYDNLPIMLTASPGNYNLMLQSGPCSYSEDVNLTEVSGNTFAINVNELNVNVYQLEIVGSSNIASVNWSQSADISCTDCPDPIVSVNTNTVMTAMVTDDNGCVYTLDVSLAYTPFIRYYIPNIVDFNNSPNDVFYVQSNFGDVVIESMRVYDRYGSLMYEIENSPVNDSSLGWNGLKDNKQVEQGVYVYVLRLPNTLGEIETHSGTFTVIR